MTPNDIFDRNTRARFRNRAAQARPEDRWIVTRMAEELIERLDPVKRNFERVLIIGNDFGALSRELVKRGANVTIADAGAAHGGVTCNEDRLPFASHSFDLVMALGTLDTVNDLPGALALIRRVLVPDGLFLGAMMGAGSLALLKSVVAIVEPGAARVHPQIDVRGAGDLLARAGFTLPVADAETLDVRYSSFMRLVGDLRANALTNAMVTRRAVTRSNFAQIAMQFEATDRRETFSIIHMTGWAPTGKVEGTS